MSAVYDKTGREIMVGDILKVFHFIGARRKHHFMFKQVVGETTLGNGTMRYLQVSHLNLKPFGESDSGYWIAKDGEKLDRYEIVQGLGVEHHHDRPKKGNA